LRVAPTALSRRSIAGRHYTTPGPLPAAWRVWYWRPSPCRAWRRTPRRTRRWPAQPRPGRC